jgi:kinetochore protein Spc24
MMRLCKLGFCGIGTLAMLTFGRLKLKLYRTLGIDVEADKTTGEYNKAVIRNAAKGDVHVVNIDPKFSRHFYTNYFWRTM